MRCARTHNNIASKTLARPPAAHLDRCVRRQSGGRAAAVHRTASARGRRQNVRKVNGVRAGFHTDSMRNARIGAVRAHSRVFG